MGWIRDVFIANNYLGKLKILVATELINMVKFDL